MEEKKNRLVIPFIIVILLLFGLIGYICYDKFLAAKEPVKVEEKENNTKKEEGKIKTELYTINSLGTYELYMPAYDNENSVWTLDEDKMTKQEENIKIDYIAINYDTESVNKFNQDSKQSATELFEIYKDIFKKSDQKIDCTCVKDDNKFGCATHLSSLKYKVSEMDNYLLVEKINDRYTNCASGAQTSEYYTISKETKELMNKSDIVNAFNYDEKDVNDKLNMAIKKKYSYYFEEGNVTDADLNRISSANYFIYNNKLYIYCLNLPGSGNDIYVYDGNNVEYIEDAFDLS